MRIFVSGLTGAIGRQLLPLLLSSGYELYSITRKEKNAEALRSLGVHANVGNLLDIGSVLTAFNEALPEVVIHQATALPDIVNLRHFDSVFYETNLLRTKGTKNLLDAARVYRVKRFIAQSFCGWPYAREEGMVKSESDRLDPSPFKGFHQTLAAIKYLEDTIVNRATWVKGVILRYGAFYGPGTGLSEDGEIVQLVKKRRMPIIGEGAGVWSFVNIEDAARATLSAVTHGSPGIYNIVDDEPATIASWLPYLAELLQAKSPIRLPVWLGKILLGNGGVSMMTCARGGLNDKAKEELRWHPRYSSWRTGFRNCLLNEINREK